MSSGRPWEERNPGMKKRYPVPAELVLELIESWLEERRNEEADQYESLGQELGIKQSGAMRMVYRLRHKETTYMSFGQADKIISALFGPQHWYTDETLNAIYEEHA